MKVSVGAVLLLLAGPLLPVSMAAAEPTALVDGSFLSSGQLVADAPVLDAPARAAGTAIDASGRDTLWIALAAIGGFALGVIAFCAVMCVLTISGVGYF